ncbi:MAG: hydroxyphenylacetyl-CoA thioesterase PaaI [Cohaesibacter sp.]|jgi:acyl-CoA thioesterase|nr:hydroxyphenylacetyl-CoA thioesterase PaaI [Cohaesibacter sp.]
MGQVFANKDELAKAAAQAMWDADPATQKLGMTLDEVREGYSRMSMVIREEMSNGHGTCHGGYIFTFADSCFAFACNSHNINTVAQQCSITYVAPGRLGETLTAECVERTLVGRSGVYDVTVRNQQGQIIAEFRGNSRNIKGELVPGARVEEA